MLGMLIKEYCKANTKMKFLKSVHLIQYLSFFSSATLIKK